MLGIRCKINIISNRFKYIKFRHNKAAYNIVEHNLFQTYTRLSYISVVFCKLPTNSTKFSIGLSAKMATTWSMGPGTYKVPLSLFAKNRARLATKLQSGQVVVLQGGEDVNHYDTDVQYVFRQVFITLIKSTCYKHISLL